MDNYGIRGTSENWSSNCWLLSTNWHHRHKPISSSLTFRGWVFFVTDSCIGQQNRNRGTFSMSSRKWFSMVRGTKILTGGKAYPQNSKPIPWMLYFLFCGNPGIKTKKGFCLVNHVVDHWQPDWPQDGVEALSHYPVFGTTAFCILPVLLIFPNRPKLKNRITIVEHNVQPC